MHGESWRGIATIGGKIGEWLSSDHSRQKSRRVVSINQPGFPSVCLSFNFIPAFAKGIALALNPPLIAFWEFEFIDEVIRFLKKFDNPRIEPLNIMLEILKGTEQ